jgi:hypothetical protein
MTMVELQRGMLDGMHIQPRWPARRIRIDALALQALRQAQAGLPDQVRMIVTRGYEPASASLGVGRTLFRALGMLAFAVLYRARRHEIADIFGANGHDIDGTHVDVSIHLAGRRVRLLPLGVFTPPWLQRRRRRQFAPAVRMVQMALRRAGFALHRNRTERAQMHCDLPAQG